MSHVTISNSISVLFRKRALSEKFSQSRSDNYPIFSFSFRRTGISCANLIRHVTYFRGNHRLSNIKYHFLNTFMIG